MGNSRYRLWTTIRWFFVTILQRIFPLFIYHDCFCRSMHKYHDTNSTYGTVHLSEWKHVRKAANSWQLLKFDIISIEHLQSTHMLAQLSHPSLWRLYLALLLRNGVTWHCWWTRSWCGGARRGWGPAPGWWASRRCSGRSSHIVHNKNLSVPYYTVLTIPVYRTTYTLKRESCKFRFRRYHRLTAYFYFIYWICSILRVRYQVLVILQIGFRPVQNCSWSWIGYQYESVCYLSYRRWFKYLSIPWLYILDKGSCLPYLFIGTSTVNH